MSPQVQMILAFTPVLLILILLAVFLKKTRFMWLVSAICILPLAVATVFLSGIVLDDPANQQLAAREAELATVRSSDYIDIANLLMVRGLTRAAEKTLDEYASSYPVNADYMVSRARLDALRGNYSSAKSALDSLVNNGEVSQNDVSAELSVLDRVINGNAAYNDLITQVTSAIQRHDCADYITEAVNVYATIDHMNTTTASSSAASSAAQQYATILENNPSMAFPATFETSYLKAMMIAGDYSTIVSRSEQYNDSHELLMMGELLRENKITEQDLTRAKAITKDQPRNEKIIEWIQHQKNVLSSEDALVLDNAIRSLSYTHTADLTTYKEWMIRRITMFAESPNERESSKLYMELAYIDYSQGNDTASAVHIRKALLFGANSEDLSFTAPINQLNEILENKDDTEALKEVDRYVQMMVSNMQAEEMKPDAGTDMNIDLSDFAEAVTENLVDSSDDAYTSITSPDNSEFSSFVSSQVNQITASINIASIDHSAFESVSAVIALDESIASTEEEFKQNIDLFDCDIAVDNYEVEKLKDAGVNIILVCDNSGSMSGSKIEDLKTAVKRFVNNADSDVRVGIVSFNSSKIDQASTHLGSNNSELLSAIDSMYANGGTNIDEGVSAALSQMQPSDAINVLIVMSDGQDNPSDEAIERIRQSCLDRDVMIYAMGLGSDVDSAQLSRFSDAGGGSYTFVSDSNTLLSFYNYLYAISRNRFRVSYTADDTILTSRKLRAEYHADAKVFDERTYNLFDNSALSEENLDNSYSLALAGVTLGGLDTRLLYKSVMDQEVRLLGSDLTNDLDIKISIKSGTTYDLTCSYESDTSWKVIVPASVSCGDYDVVVTVNGKRGVFKSGLIVTSNKLNVVRFGQYVFEATSVGQMDGAIALSGFVQMNGWLGFTGTVTITGNPNTDASIILDAPMTYVRYRKGSEELSGLASVYADCGTTINIHRIQNLRLYRNLNTPPSSDSFRVDQMIVPNIVVQNMLEMELPGLSLYPDRMEIDFNQFTTKFPMQDLLLKAGEVDKLFSFKAEHQEKMIISQFGLDFDLELKVESTDKKEYSTFPSKKLNAFFGNMRLYVNLDEFELKINTTKEDSLFSFKIAVNVAMLSDGLGLEMKWSKGQFDSAKFFADFDIPTNIGGVPATFSDFSLGVSGLSTASTKGFDLTGGCKVSFAKVSSFLPGIEKFVNDVAVFSLDEVNLALHFGDFRIGMSAKFMLFESVELGHAQIDMGKSIPYSNPLLGYDDTTVDGIVGKVGLGIKCDTSNLKLDVSAETEMALTSHVCGITAEGKVKYDVRWWIFGVDNQFSGKLFLGCYQKHNQKYAFALILQGNDNNPVRFEWDVDKVIA